MKINTPDSRNLVPSWKQKAAQFSFLDLRATTRSFLSDDETVSQFNTDASLWSSQANRTISEKIHYLYLVLCYACPRVCVQTGKACVPRQRYSDLYMG